MSNEAVAASAAKRLREVLGAGLAPIGDLFEFAYRIPGVDAMSTDAEDHEHGRCARIPGTDRAVVIVATTPNPMRQRSTLAHELGHVYMRHDSSDFDPARGQRTPPEIQANAFARHLLVPLHAVRSKQSSPTQDPLETLAELVQEFEASPDIVAIQMRDAGLIDEALRARWSENLSTPQIAARFGWHEQYVSLARESQISRPPQRLVRLMIEGVDREVFGVDELRLWYGEGADHIATPANPIKDKSFVDDDAFDGLNL